ncbi:hypothetical protein HK097_004668, partial [Rhizophlyctis rosea]
MAKRAVEEIHDWINTEVIPTLRKLNYPSEIAPLTTTPQKYKLYLSIVGHSLGGLIARYVARLLLDPTPPLFGPSPPLPTSTPTPTNPYHLPTLLHNHPTLMENLIPLTFMTICSPHLGSRRSPQPASHIFTNITRLVSQLYLSYIAGSTGKELLMADGAGGDGWWDVDSSESSGRSNGTGSTGPKELEDLSIPLLYRMSMPESAYMNAIGQFKGVTLLSAVRNDVPVAFCSAAICAEHLHPEVFEERGSHRRSKSDPSDRKEGSSGSEGEDERGGGEER